MSEMDDLVSEVRSLLTSHGAYTSRTAWLRAGCLDTDLELGLDTTTPLGECVLEVGDESIYVRSWDEISSTAIVAPDGRGWDGTTAASHGVGDRALVDPTHPRTTIRRAISQALNRLWPDVWAVASHEFLADAAVTEYVLPSDALALLRVDAEDFRGEWCEVRSYVWTADGPEGPTVELRGAVVPGRTVRVVYNRRVDPADLETGSWASVGLSDSARSAVIYAATAHLMRFTETGRLTSVAASSDSYEGARPFYVTSIKIASDLDQQYQVAVAEERRRLRQKYPPRIVRTR